MASLNQLYNQSSGGLFERFFVDDPNGDDLTFTTTSDNTSCVLAEVSGSALMITEVATGTSQNQTNNQSPGVPTS